MKKPSFEQGFFLTALLIVASAAFYTSLSRAPSPEPERYIDYCGDSLDKRPGAVQQEGVTPLLLPDRDVPKYREQVQWIRPATSEELGILLRRYALRSLPSGYQLWTVTVDAPSIAHTLARQYQCVIEGMLDTSE
ncbi:MAG: hypothetical protein WD690_10145 [Vicinamibacterales bacterium]